MRETDGNERKREGEKRGRARGERAEGEVATATTLAASFSSFCCVVVVLDCGTNSAPRASYKGS